MMSLLSTSSSVSPLQLSCTQQECRFLSPSSISCSRITRTRSIGFNPLRVGNRSRITAFFFNPAQDPLVKEAVKEPVAFLGGIFAGILRLDLNEEPLKEWVMRTVEASDISEEETNAEESTTEAAPQEIEIE
ncbi:UPF0426 protein At1g28150, chloroplastic isoform X1 [Medicago truncatula]|uniref:UPF0426 protein At1g28150, chloroplastic isoform X1 n=1 Tax=Medicago truncatula TaxID=3880 RepID=UPI000D2F26F6|nr:UPF0426 protein At1g28150, chloroplastic isoform X1 [Medicago truncatula]